MVLGDEQTLGKSRAQVEVGQIDPVLTVDTVDAVEATRNFELTNERVVGAVIDLKAAAAPLAGGHEVSAAVALVIDGGVLHVVDEVSTAGDDAVHEDPGRSVAGLCAITPDANILFGRIHPLQLVVGDQSL